MPESAEQPTPYVFDNQALIELERLGHIRGLPRSGVPLVVPPKVLEEARRPKGTPLAKWVENRPPLYFLPDEGRIYLELRSQRDLRIGDGEAFAIAIALHRNGTLVTEDKAARTKAERHGVRCITAQQFLNEWPPRLL